MDPDLNPATPPWLRQDQPGIKAIHGYKWMLTEKWEFQTELRHSHSAPRKLCDNALLYREGKLELHRGFVWDGPSGPTIDTQGWMRASAVHDALYRALKEDRLRPQAYRGEPIWGLQRYREGEVVDVSLTRHAGGRHISRSELREYADQLMYDELLADGTWSLRAAWSWAAVRLSPWAARRGPWRLVNRWL